MMNAINFASSHLCRRLFLCRLIPEDVFDLGIQLIRGVIDEFEIASFNLFPCTLAQILSKHGFDKC